MGYFNSYSRNNAVEGRADYIIAETFCDYKVALFALKTIQKGVSETPTMQTIINNNVTGSLKHSGYE